MAKSLSDLRSYDLSNARTELTGMTASSHSSQRSRGPMVGADATDSGSPTFKRKPRRSRTLVKMNGHEADGIENTKLPRTSKTEKPEALVVNEESSTPEEELKPENTENNGAAEREKEEYRSKQAQAKGKTVKKATKTRQAKGGKKAQIAHGNLETPGQINDKSTIEVAEEIEVSPKKGNNKRVPKVEKVEEEIDTSRPTPKKVKRDHKVKIEEELHEDEETGKKVRQKRRTKEEKEAEAMPLAPRTTALRMFIGAHVSCAKGLFS